MFNHEIGCVELIGGCDEGVTNTSVLQLFLFCVCMLPVHAFVILNFNGNDRRIWTCMCVRVD